MGKIIDFIKTILPNLSTSDVFIIIFSLVILVLIIAIYVYNDSKLRGGNALGWLIAVIVFGGILPLVFYLMIRSPYTLEEIKEEKERKEVLELQKKYYELQIEKEIFKCPVCGEEVKSDYLYCPHCFTQLKNKCPNCQKIIEKDAKICPYCGFIFEERKE
ncbi:MAG: zinc ribbon domain-containing protein [Caldisericum exile]|uniref:zinc ribbon domain-containing protein n=1 Tax=Caldisericum exile TaxID=693075 RepID=UPI003C70E1F8